jgi:hypothetical protein
MPTTVLNVQRKEHPMTVMIGIDPHKGSHTAVAVDASEHSLAELRVRSGPKQLERLLKWVERFAQRTWAATRGQAHRTPAPNAAGSAAEARKERHVV